jgi:hypothetical protein
MSGAFFILDGDFKKGQLESILCHWAEISHFLNDAYRA